MNKLMFAPFGVLRYMDAAGEGGGGGAPSDPPADPKDPPADPKDPPADPNDPPAAPKDPPADPKDPPADPNDPPADPKDPPKDPEDPISALAQKVKDPPADPKDPPADPKDPPAEVNDEDFVKMVVADEETKKFAEKSGAKGFEISAEVTKKMLPAFRAAGVTPEQASKLSNAYAREQISQIAAYRQQRVENIKQMNQEAFKAFPNESDWKAIARARDRFFKPAGKDGKGGTMLHTIATSELGSDLEFLALLKFVGDRLGTDTTPTAGGAGAGHPKVSMAKALGIS